MNKESRRRALVGALKRLTPDMEETLRKSKAEGNEGMKRPDFVWHFLLQSFATMGRSSGWDGLEAARIGTQYVYLKGGRRTLDHLGSYQASR